MADCQQLLTVRKGMICHRDESAVSACLDLGFTRVYIQDALSATFAYTPDFSNEVIVQA